MFLYSPLPSWKQIITNKKSLEQLYWENRESLLFPKSCVSLRFLFSCYRKFYNKERILIYIPDYFCDETIQSFREDWMDFYYYQIGEDLEPQWKLIESYTKENPSVIDFFIFVHYFGMEKNVSMATDFAKRHGALLIEDCAHVLLSKGKIASKGNFVIFSPHKQLPVYDSSVLSYNPNEKTTDLWNAIKNQYENVPEGRKNSLWYLKKVFQKFFKLHRTIPYYLGVHFGSRDIFCESIQKISAKSAQILRTYYDYTELKKICYIRRDNLSMMNYLINKIDSSIIPLLDAQTFSPYYAVYSLKNVKDKKKTVEKLINKGFSVLFWPDLPRDISDKITEHEAAFVLSENIITIPIHQDLTPQKICKKLGKEFLEKKHKIELTIDWNKITKSHWYSLYKKIPDVTIPQDWVFGEAKRDVEGWGVDRGIVKNADGKEIGLVQLLSKKILGVPVAYLVNRGPLFLSDYDTVDNHLQVIEIIKHKIAGIRPVVFEPIIRWSPDAIRKLVSYNYKFMNIFGFPSGTIDLTRTEEEIKKSFDSKWRNQLVTAEKKNNKVYKNFGNYEDYVKIYSRDKQNRKFVGVDDDILRFLCNQENVIDIYSAYSEDKTLLGFDFFYLHGKKVTYLIGWNSNEGRKDYLNNLLLYKSIIGSKERGMKIFDLCGIEDIHTEGIAKFKRGTKPVEYRLAGEFLKL